MSENLESKVEKVGVVFKQGQKNMAGNTCVFNGLIVGVMDGVIDGVFDANFLKFFPVVYGPVMSYFKSEKNHKIEGAVFLTGLTSLAYGAGYIFAKTVKKTAEYFLSN